MLPQENLDFYISLDRFWCILSTLVHKYYDFLETSFVPHFVGASLTVIGSQECTLRYTCTITDSQGGLSPPLF
jgi:hypothetical protein